MSGFQALVKCKAFFKAPQVLCTTNSTASQLVVGGVVGEVVLPADAGRLLVLQGLQARAGGDAVPQAPAERAAHLVTDARLERLQQVTATAQHAQELRHLKKQLSLLYYNKTIIIIIL